MCFHLKHSDSKLRSFQDLRILGVVADGFEWEGGLGYEIQLNLAWENCWGVDQQLDYFLGGQSL